MPGKTSEDKSQAHATRIYALGVSDTMSSEAVDAGVEVLKELGEKFPSQHFDVSN
jgi:hypothetical protein